MSNTIKVYPNPWGVHPSVLKKMPKGDVANVMSADGYPSNVVLMEPAVGEEVKRRYVGARLNRNKTKVHEPEIPKGATQGFPPGTKIEQLASPRQTSVWTFLGVDADEPNFAELYAKTEPVEVPATAYYMGELRGGGLLPGDSAAAAIAGYRCTRGDFATLDAVARGKKPEAKKSSGGDQDGAVSGSPAKNRGK